MIISTEQKTEVILALTSRCQEQKRRINALINEISQFHLDIAELYMCDMLSKDRQIEAQKIDIENLRTFTESLINPKV